MKKTLFCALLITAALAPLKAQYRGEGLALRYETAGSGLYASHATFPFGTKLVVTNLGNNQRVTVQVGGRTSPQSPASVEISPDAAEILGIKNASLTRVRIEEVPKESKPRVMRMRMGAFNQTGPAVVSQSAGTALTALHPSLPIGTKLKITNNGNGLTTVLTVSGRIRASENRIVELSHAAARALGIQRPTSVRLEMIN